MPSQLPSNLWRYSLNVVSTGHSLPWWGSLSMWKSEISYTTYLELLEAAQWFQAIPTVKAQQVWARSHCILSFTQAAVGIGVASPCPDHCRIPELPPLLSFWNVNKAFHHVSGHCFTFPAADFIVVVIPGLPSGPLLHALMQKAALQSCTVIPSGVVFYCIEGAVHSKK